MSLKRKPITQHDIEARAKSTALAREQQQKEAWGAIVPPDIGASALPADITKVGQAIGSIRRNQALARAREAMPSIRTVQRRKGRGR